MEITYFIRGLMDKKHHDGDHAEAIAAEYFVAKGYWVFYTPHAHSPVDLIAINPRPEVIFIDVKKDTERILSGRRKPTRITRVRSALQKLIGVRICYVYLKTRQVHLSEHKE